MSTGCLSGPVSAKGLTESSRFPHQLIWPWKHQGGQEEQGAQVIASNPFVRVTGALNVGVDR